MYQTIAARYQAALTFAKQFELDEYRDAMIEAVEKRFLADIAYQRQLEQTESLEPTLNTIPPCN